MDNRVFISDDDLAKYGSIQNLSEKAEALLIHQKKNWDLVSDNYSALSNVKIRRYDFDSFYINTQFNPSRIISSSAKVDQKSIENRACFLCEENLPETQKGINYKNKYVLLCNPYPIFKQHLTIPHHNHIPQNIENSFKDMLELTYDLKDSFFVFYNGPKCGASAPDHLHFQAGLKNSTPIESYYKNLLSNYSRVLLLNNEITVSNIMNKFLNLIYLNSRNSEQIELIFAKILIQLKTLQQTNEEPLLNILCFFKNEEWHVFVIPRKKHRPDQFFRNDESKILISPAAVDMAGLCITPREKDFENLDKNDIENIYAQVTLKDELLDSLKDIVKV